MFGSFHRIVVTIQFVGNTPQKQILNIILYTNMYGLKESGEWTLLVVHCQALHGLREQSNDKRLKARLHCIHTTCNLDLACYVTKARKLLQRNITKGLCGKDCTISYKECLFSAMRNRHFTILHLHRLINIAGDAHNW